jgi:hypothetical protein
MSHKLKGLAKTNDGMHAQPDTNMHCCEPFLALKYKSIVLEETFHQESIIGPKKHGKIIASNLFVTKTARAI